VILAAVGYLALRTGPDESPFDEDDSGDGTGGGAAAVGAMRVRWSDGHRALAFRFRGREYQCPKDMVEGKFPPAGARPEFHVEKKWPVVTMEARWTASTKGWPPKYRPDALDLILVYATDAQLYADIYPEIIKSSAITVPPEFLKEAQNATTHDLVEAMRGRSLEYDVTAKGGFGASDYQLKGKITAGLSGDGKTVFYYDKPDLISKHLKNREYVFGARDAGEHIHFDVKMVCVCGPQSAILRGEAMKRVEDAGRYLVEKMYEDLDNAPTEKEIEDYLEMAKKRGQPLKDPGK
jgi:hypothetical protein